MLKMIFICIFMIPLIFYMWMMCNMMLMLTLIFVVFFDKKMLYTGYMMQIDSMSYSLILLSIWISFLMILSSPKYKYNNMKLFSIMVLLLMMFLIMSFCSSNLMIFYICFESSLIPTVVIIMGWGYQPERIIASYYLLFYTLFASLPLLMSLIMLNKTNMTSIMFLMKSNVNMYMYMYKIDFSIFN